MSDHAETIRTAASHIARGCRSNTGHLPDSYLIQMDAALTALVADRDLLRTVLKNVLEQYEIHGRHLYPKTSETIIVPVFDAARAALEATEGS